MGGPGRPVRPKNSAENTFKSLRPLVDALIEEGGSQRPPKLRSIPVSRIPSGLARDVI